jgi:hypothetical protein
MDQSTFPSSCYVSLFSVIPYIFLRPIHTDVDNYNGMTSVTGDKHFGLNGLEQSGPEESTTRGREARRGVQQEAERPGGEYNKR